MLSRALVFRRDGAKTGEDISPPGRRLPQGDCLRCLHRRRCNRPIGMSLVGDLAPGYSRRVSDWQDWFGNLFRGFGCEDQELEWLRLRGGRRFSALLGEDVLPRGKDLGSGNIVSLSHQKLRHR